VRAGAPPPNLPADEHAAAFVLGRYCAACHTIDGEGGLGAPDLTRVGAMRDAKWLRDWISSPESVDPAASMPAFGEVLTEEQMTAVVNYLAARK
jgi:mono/diheme cytochrome c family protein